MPRKKLTDTGVVLPSESGAAAAAAPAKKHRTSTRTTAAPTGARKTKAPAAKKAEITESVTNLAAAVENPVVLDRVEIARLAYSYWEQRGCQGGSPDEDWLRAEQELAARLAAR